jgi:hypothetical protein
MVFHGEADMAVRCSSSWIRRSGLLLAGAMLAALGGCVVAPVDPYYEVGAPVMVQPGPSYYYGAPYYASPYWSRPYYAAPPVSIGIHGWFGSGSGRHWRGDRGGHRGHWSHRGGGHRGDFGGRGGRRR